MSGRAVTIASMRNHVQYAALVLGWICFGCMGRNASTEQGHKSARPTTSPAAHARTASEIADARVFPFVSEGTHLVGRLDPGRVKPSDVEQAVQQWVDE